MRNIKWITGRWSAATLLLAISAIASAPGIAIADQGGISFWLPGIFGSLAAVPGVPGLSFQTLYVHTSVATSANKTFPLNGQIVTGLKGSGNLAAFGPTYIFETPVLGGQAAFSVLGIGGKSEASVSATLTGPRGNTISGTATDSRTGFGDVLPMASLKWNAGVNNFMTYLTGDIPAGAYDKNRLANLGLGHGAIDGGGGYTFLDPSTGHEFSATAGFTYNFTNQAIDYQNGIDFHLDWGASQFLSKEVFVGLAGYLLNQITGDSGSGARLGSFESRVAGIGPQLGTFIPMGGAQAFLGLKGYKEFGNQNRPPGWNFWVTFAISPAPPAAPAAAQAFRF